MFIPHTDSEREEMLKTIGVPSIEALFNDVPAEYRFPTLNLPPALTEMEIAAQLQELSQINESTRDLICFLGAGAYNHFIPAAVDSILRRGEFYTAYTPYQPEVSQGTLQAVFEFQSLISNLTGMDLSNASHYDGATAVAEAAVLAYHHFRGKRSRFILSPAVNPQYRQVLRTYMDGYDNLQIIGDREQDNPLGSLNELIGHLDHNTAMVFVQYPDFFGRVQDLTDFAAKVHAVGALLTVVINPTALALFKSPGEMGADLAVGEGQPLGIPLSFGGPYLGIFAAKKDYVRKIAGRLIGETIDREGKRGYVLTLTAREQHIRRDKATSNICTNQGLIALAATVYMSLLGKHGLRQVAELCYHKAHFLAQQINQIPGFSVDLNQPFFHEFVMKCPAPVAEINEHLLDNGILGGFDLSKDYPALENQMLLAVTEMNTREEMDLLCEVLKEYAND
ncbi:MAG: aminomethyl-transferring glycine dehydrogenase subunit GcvPA [Chloroflexota bacterium]